MDETTCERFPKTIEYSANQCKESCWKESKGSNNPGKVSEMRSLPINSCKHEPGCIFSLVDQAESNAQETQGISHTEASSFEESDHEEGKKVKLPPTYDKPHVYSTKQQDRKIHATRANGINDWQKSKGDCRIEGEEHEDISTSEPDCPNRERIRGMHLALGQLLQISPMGSSIRTKWIPCQFVYPQFHVRNDESLESMHKVSEDGRLDESQRCCNNSPMVIEIIASEYERHLFASYVNHGSCEVSNLNCIKVGSDLNIYVNMVQDFGFNHIILIGEREYGIIFLDCYGRVFVLDTMTDVLWPLGDTLEEAVMKPFTGKVAWGLDEEAGIIYEFEYYGTVSENQDQEPLTIGKTHNKIKNNKGKKKKNKKNKNKKNKKNSTIF